jgi:hypothetical protein
MSKVDDLISYIHQEKKEIGDIIEDRSLNGIPFGPYLDDYNEYSDIEKVLAKYKNTKLKKKRRK